MHIHNLLLEVPNYPKHRDIIMTDYDDDECETRPDLKGEVSNLTVRDGLYRLFDPDTCDNPAEMRQWHRVIISVPYHDHADLWDTIHKYLYQDYGFLNTISNLI
jgi:hypothetical protein